MGQLLIINAPASFTVIWAAIKPLLSSDTLRKVNILGSDYEHALTDLIPAENLPKQFGGQCTCSGEGGCAFSNAGPWMDGREERRRKWLAGELDRPGVPSSWGGLATSAHEEARPPRSSVQLHSHTDPTSPGAGAGAPDTDALSEKRAEMGAEAPTRSPALQMAVPSMSEIRDLVLVA